MFGYYRGWVRCHKCEQIYFRGNTYSKSVCINCLSEKYKKDLSDKAIEQQKRDLGTDKEILEKRLKEFKFQRVG